MARFRYNEEGVMRRYRITMDDGTVLDVTEEAMMTAWAWGLIREIETL